LLHIPEEGASRHIWSFAGYVLSSVQFATASVVLAYVYWRKPAGLGRAIVAERVSAGTYVTLALIVAGAALGPDAFIRGGILAGSDAAVNLMICVMVALVLALMQF